MLVSHYPQTCAVDQRVGRHYRRFRGNVRPANKENQKLGRRPRLRRGLNQGRIREVRLGELNEAEAADRQAHLANPAATRHRLHIASEITDPAKQPFPEEPIRTLDALHLASALTARATVTALDILSLDERVRKSAKKLGLSLLPEHSH